MKSQSTKYYMPLYHSSGAENLPKKLLKENIRNIPNYAYHVFIACIHSYAFVFIIEFFKQYTFQNIAWVENVYKNILEVAVLKTNLFSSWKNYFKLIKKLACQNLKQRPWTGKKGDQDHIIFFENGHHKIVSDPGYEGWSSFYRTRVIQ